MGITVSTFGILGGIKEFTRKNKQYEVIEMPDGMKQNLEKMYAKGYVKVRIDKNKFEVIARNIIAKKRVTKVRPDLQTALYMPLVNFNLAIDPEKDDKTKEITILVPRILSDPKNLRLLAPLSPGNQSQLFEQIDSYGKFYKGPTADPVDVLLRILLLWGTNVADPEEKDFMDIIDEPITSAYTIIKEYDPLKVYLIIASIVLLIILMIIFLIKRNRDEDLDY